MATITKGTSKYGAAAGAVTTIAVTALTVLVGDIMTAEVAIHTGGTSSNAVTSISDTQGLTWSRSTDGSQAARVVGSTVNFEIWQSTAAVSGSAVEAVTITLNASDGGRGSTAIVTPLQNFGSVNKVGTSTGNISGALGIPCPSVTTTVGNTQVLIGGTIQDNGDTLTAPTGYADLGNPPGAFISSGGGLQIAGNVSAGTVSPGNIDTGGAADNYASISMAIVQAGGGGGTVAGPSMGIIPSSGFSIGVM